MRIRNRKYTMRTPEGTIKIELRGGPELDRAVERARPRVAKRQGALLVKSAKRKIKKLPKKPKTKKAQERWRKKIKAGQTPWDRQEGKGALKTFILGAYDAQKKVLVVGPKLLPRKIKGVPKVLEYGGTTSTINWARKIRRVKIRSRAFMRPTLKENLAKMAEIWKDSIKPTGR